MIDSYQFGEMVIQGVSYTKDVIICPDRIEAEWWRKEGHYLHLPDIQKIIEEVQPRSLIVGKGKFGMMRVGQGLKDYLKSHHIVLYAKSTDKVVQIFNRLINTEEKVIGAFHLTC